MNIDVIQIKYTYWAPGRLKGKAISCRSLKCKGFPSDHIFHKQGHINTYKRNQSLTLANVVKSRLWFLEEYLSRKHSKICHYYKLLPGAASTESSENPYRLIALHCPGSTGFQVQIYILKLSFANIFVRWFKYTLSNLYIKYTKIESCVEIKSLQKHMHVAVRACKVLE